MEKKGIAEVVEKLARGAASQQNMLGNELTTVGRAVGNDDDASAAMNSANIAAVVALGAIAGGAAMISFNADKKSKMFYGKLDSYGGLGVPMDESCKPQITAGFSDWKKVDVIRENNKALPSSIVIARHISHNQDKAITRAINNDTSIWQLFLFSKQLVKNRVAFGISGNYPPRIELSLADFDMSMLDPDTLLALRNDFAKNNIRFEASGASDRIGECNISANYNGYETALKTLGKDKYKNIKELDGMRAALEAQLNSKDLFGFDIPQLFIPAEALSSLSSSDIEKVIHTFEKKGISVQKQNGGLTICGMEDNFIAFEQFMSSTGGNYNGKDFDMFRELVSKFKDETLHNYSGELNFLRRELKGFDSIKFKLNNGRCIIQTDHGLEDIVQVLMAMNRYPESWDKGIKGQLKKWADKNQIDPKYSASFIYGERQGSAAVQRTIYSRVKDEELSATSNVAPEELLFWENGQCIITHPQDGELERITANNTREFQQQLLGKLPNAQSNAVTLSDESVAKLAEALSQRQGGI